MSTSSGEPEQEHPVLNIVRERVGLGPFRKDLLPLYQRWINDFGALRTLGGFMPSTMESETKWYEEWATSEKIIPFTIYALPEKKPIGTTALMDIDHRNRRAEFGIFVGEPGSRSKGYGTEMTCLILDYAFSTAGLHNVMLTSSSSTRRASELTKKRASRSSGDAGSASSPTESCGARSSWSVCPQNSGVPCSSKHQKIL